MRLEVLDLRPQALIVVVALSSSPSDEEVFATAVGRGWGMRVGGGATSSSDATREQPGGPATIGVLGASSTLLLLLPEAVLDAAIAAGDDAIAAGLLQLLLLLLQLLLAALTDVVLQAPLQPSCSLQHQSCLLVMRIHVKEGRAWTTKPIYVRKGNMLACCPCSIDAHGQLRLHCGLLRIQSMAALQQFLIPHHCSPLKSS